jgi:predicted glutamine amidotransferase
MTRAANCFGTHFTTRIEPFFENFSRRVGKTKCNGNLVQAVNWCFCREMCRMFVARSKTKRSFSNAFSTLRRLAIEHKDGWGIAQMDAVRSAFETSIESASTSSRFLEIGNAIESSSLFAHIRLASVGTVDIHNTHPFYANGFWFMHNGTVQSFANSKDKIENQLCPKLFLNVKGHTDSERCFYLFLTLLGKTAQESTSEEVANTLAKVVRLVTETCDVDTNAVPSALNFALSDGVRVWVTRHGRGLVYADDGETKFIASEPLFEGIAWNHVPEDSLVTIDAQLNLSVQPLA